MRSDNCMTISSLCSISRMVSPRSLSAAISVCISAVSVGFMPTAGMNPTETAEMQTLIAALKERGLTILLIEHKLEMVMQLSDRIYVLDDGAKIAEGPPAAVRNDPAVIEAYLGHNDIGQTQSESAATEMRKGRAWA